MHKTFKHLNVLQETTIIPFPVAAKLAEILSLYYSINNSIQIFWQCDTVRFFSSFLFFFNIAVIKSHNMQYQKCLACFNDV